MKRFFTSDWHLGSNLINKYAHRPFVSAGDAAQKLVDNCNDVAKKADVVFHVGDFWLSGKDRHDGVEDENTLTATVDDYIRFISARLVLLEGNHDTSNVETDLKSMYVDLNQNYRYVYVSHYPSCHKLYNGPNRHCLTTRDPAIVLCGHVHDSWLLNYDRKNAVLNINVGVDVWDYKPVEDVTLTKLLDFITHAKVKMPKDKMTPDEVRTWYEMEKKHTEASRLFHKMERYAKKGLTPEECLRRKEEAMKAKGLDPNFKKQKAKPKEGMFSHADAIQFGIVPPDSAEGYDMLPM